MTRARWLALAVLVLAAVFAYHGGFISTAGYRALQADEAASTIKAVRLQREVDSLKAFADSLEHDPAVQERVARDQFGMLRPGEISFMIVPVKPPKPDSASKSP
ncbi:MAG: septum formation initiator family protein [Gemmatimonadota bacterium]